MIKGTALVCNNGLLLLPDVELISMTLLSCKSTCCKVVNASSAILAIPHLSTTFSPTSTERFSHNKNAFCSAQSKSSPRRTISKFHRTLASIKCSSAYARNLPIQLRFPKLNAFKALASCTAIFSGEIQRLGMKLFGSEKLRGERKQANWLTQTLV